MTLSYVSAAALISLIIPLAICDDSVPIYMAIEEYPSSPPFLTDIMNSESGCAAETRSSCEIFV